MSTPRELSRIANRIAGKMTGDGWVSPGRKNNEIWREFDDGKRVHIIKQMIFKKIFVSRQKDKYYIQCIEKRDAK